MDWQSKQIEKRKLEKLYNATKHSCTGGGAFFHEGKGRYIRYYTSGKSKYTKYLKRLSNKKVRHSSLALANSEYKKIFDYWWSLD